MQQSPALAAAQTDPLSLSTQRQLASQSRGLEGRTAQRVTSRLRIVFPRCGQACNSDTYTWVAIAQLMRMRNLLKHSDELSSSSVMCIEFKMEAQSRYSYLARVEKELKALHKEQESVLVLNYYNLREFPDVLLCDEHCRKRLRKLYLKRNLITSLVRKCKLAPFASFLGPSPRRPHPPQDLAWYQSSLVPRPHPACWGRG